MVLTAEIPLGDVMFEEGFAEVHIEETGWEIVASSGEAHFVSSVRFPEGSGARMNRLVRWTHVAHCKIQGKKDWRDAIDEVLIILRLFKEGYLVTPLCRILEEEPLGYHTVNYYLPWRATPKEKRSSLETEMSIGVRDATALVVHIKNFAGKKFYKHAGLRSFANFYFYPRYVDRLLSLAIAFDNLLFPTKGDGEPEKAHPVPFARRLVEFVAPDHEERFHGKCLEFYEWRSVIAHGDYLVEQDDIQDLTDEFERLC